MVERDGRDIPRMSHRIDKKITMETECRRNQLEHTWGRIEAANRAFFLLDRRTCKHEDEQMDSNFDFSI